MINDSLFSHQSNDWETPQDFFDELDREFHFNLDPCATSETKKCHAYFTKENNGLIQDWGGIMYFAIRPMDLK